MSGVRYKMNYLLKALGNFNLKSKSHRLVTVLCLLLVIFLISQDYLQFYLPYMDPYKISNQPVRKFEKGFTSRLQEKQQINTVMQTKNQQSKEEETHQLREEKNQDNNSVLTPASISNSKPRETTRSRSSSLKLESTDSKNTKPLTKPPSESETLLREMAKSTNSQGNSTQHKHIQIIIVSEWRSGSSFLFDLFDFSNMAFPVFEPFLMYRNISVSKLRNWQQFSDTMSNTKDILKCNKLSPDFDKNSMMLKRTHLFEMCKKNIKNKKTCTNRNFLKSMCESLPITLIKFVRISFSLLENLLTDDKINDNLHVILLSRDPRSVMSSRWNKKKTGWCTGECANVDIHCKDMSEDLTAWHAMREKFPGRVHLLRFEDMALNPTAFAEEIFKDLNLDINDNVRKFINYRTKTESTIATSTVRKSDTRVIPWTVESDFKTINKIQLACKPVIEKYGYKLTDTLKNITVSDVIHPFPVT